MGGKEEGWHVFGPTFSVTDWPLSTRPPAIRGLVSPRRGVSARRVGRRARQPQAAVVTKGGGERSGRRGGKGGTTREGHGKKRRSNHGWGTRQTGADPHLFHARCCGCSCQSARGQPTNGGGGNGGRTRAVPPSAHGRPATGRGARYATAGWAEPPNSPTGTAVACVRPTAPWSTARAVPLLRRRRVGARPLPPRPDKRHVQKMGRRGRPPSHCLPVVCFKASHTREGAGPPCATSPPPLPPTAPPHPPASLLPPGPPRPPSPRTAAGAGG